MINQNEDKKADMGRIINQFFMLFFVIIFPVLMGFGMPTYALQSKLSFEQLGINNNMTMKTVTNTQEVQFTRPKNIQFSSNPKFTLIFTQSPALLPHRSSLTVLLNGNVIKTIKYSTLKDAVPNIINIDLPVEFLKDYNKLTFTVNQHYIDKCEDPFDTSLWTIISKKSNINMDYIKKPAPIDFAQYPFPFFDELSYNPTEINYAEPDFSKISNQTLTSISYINSNLAKFVGWRDLIVKTSSNVIDSKSKIIIGTPDENREIYNYTNYIPYKLTNGLFTYSDGQPLKDEGILMLIRNPKDASSVILFITGNTPEAVLKAATALEQNPISRALKGDRAIIKTLIPNKPAKLRDLKDYVHNRDTSLQDIGLNDKTIRGFASNPIEYNFKLMSDMFFEPKTRAKLTAYYSYSRAINYDLSDLEVVLNGISLQSKKLVNYQGDKTKVDKLELEIPVELLRPYNTLQFKFHLFPIKQGYCNFVTDEHIWGTIYKNTKLKLPAIIKAKIPDIDYINDGGYPFTAFPDMQNTMFVLNKNIDSTDFKSLLDLTASFAKQMFFNDYMNFKVIKADSFNKKQSKNYNIIAIGRYNNFDFYKYLEKDTLIDYSSKTMDFKNPDNTKKFSDVITSPDLGIVEQIISPFNNKRVIMILFGKNNTGLNNASSLFIDKDKFLNIKSGNIALVSKDTVKYVNNYPEDKKIFLYTNDLDVKKIFGIPLNWIVKGLIILILFWAIRNLFIRKK